MNLRNLILDNVRRIALASLWQKDEAKWTRCADILDREGKRIQRSYTAEREVANA